MKFKYWLLTIVFALFLAACGEPDIDKELEEFKRYSNIPATSPATDIEDNSIGSAKRSNVLKTRNGEWYAIASLKNHREIERSLRIAATNVPELGWWIADAVDNGSPWKIWDIGGTKVPGTAWARTESTLLGDEGQTCDTHLDMADIQKDQEKYDLGENFLALILAHEASHCEYDHEAKGVWAEVKFLERSGDRQLDRVVEAHQDCLDSNNQWKKECG